MLSGVLRSNGDAPQLDECTHDLDVHRDGPIAWVQDASSPTSGQHPDPVQYRPVKVM
jgi:hypothetical protein